MAITRTPMVDDDGSGTTGTIINNAWKQQLYDQIDAANAGQDSTVAAIGTWTSMPFSASNYFGGGGLVWTVNAGNIITHQYSRIGKVLLMSLVVINSTTSGIADVRLSVRLPAGMTIGAPTRGNAFFYYDGATTWSVGSLEASQGLTSFDLIKNPAGNSPWNLISGVYISAVATLVIA